jgi:hypothetical protein
MVALFRRRRPLQNLPRNRGRPGMIDFLDAVGLFPADRKARRAGCQRTAGWLSAHGRCRVGCHRRGYRLARTGVMAGPAIT